MSSRSPARVPYIEAALATQRSEYLFSTIAKHRSAFFFFASVFPSIIDLCARCDRGSEARALARVCDGRDCVRRACDTRTTRTDVHLDSRVSAPVRAVVCVHRGHTLDECHTDAARTADVWPASDCVRVHVCMRYDGAAFDVRALSRDDARCARRVDANAASHWRTACVRLCDRLRRSFPTTQHSDSSVVHIIPDNLNT